MDTNYPNPHPEIWAGVECTINRVGDDFRDQLADAGHYRRGDDISYFARLGIKRLRYPVLWEHHQPNEDDDIDWSWTTRQLNSIRENNIIPIAGLLHHGSGPSYTQLLDGDFPYKLASYAGKVAAQFPWLTYYTPVNEPLTTARFSGLYGFWYPHHKDECSFFRMLLNQVKAIILSMQAIRVVNPSAQLVQTEDLAKTHATSLLSYQASFENERRWLTYDLLCGRFDRDHYFWSYCLSAGIPETELAFFLDNSCPPATMGFNYYVTSERYLDEHVCNYPPHTHGGNGKHSYADTEANRTGHAEGLSSLLEEAWLRYRLPIAVTECHLSCTREEQMCWLRETWDSCCDLRKKGIDITAVTAWSLLGACDWDTLLVSRNENYETGVFDIRSGHLRPTILAKMVRSLSLTKEFNHPLMNTKGWWQQTPVAEGSSVHPPLLILGRNGTLGNAFMKICDQRRIACIGLSHQTLDICNEAHIRAAIEKFRPWGIINAAGYVNVDDAEMDPQKCFAINATGPYILSRVCREQGIRMMTFSSDLVFDGDKRAPYHEADTVMPLNVYGESKASGEQLALGANPSALIIRTSAFFGPWDTYNFVHKVLHSLRHDEDFHTTGDISISPTYVPDLATNALDLFIDEAEGIWHMANDGITSWSDFAQQIAERGGYTRQRICIRKPEELGWKARRPLFSGLHSKKGIKLPSVENALERYFAAL